MGDDPVVAVEGLSVEAGGVEIIRRVWMTCRPGDWVVLVGPSGSGKSTLLRAINGLCRPTAGSIRTLGTVIPGRSRKESRRAWRQTGTVLQEVALFTTRTAEQNVALGLLASGWDRRTARREARRWLARLGLDDKAGSYPQSLSGGERQRVALARALAPAPRLLLLDEPTSALDQRTAATALDAVGELVERGGTVVMSSHRTEEIDDRCTKRAVLVAGRLLDDRAVGHAAARVATPVGGG